MYPTKGLPKATLRLKVWLNAPVTACNMIQHVVWPDSLWTWILIVTSNSESKNKTAAFDPNKRCLSGNTSCHYPSTSTPLSQSHSWYDMSEGTMESFWQIHREGRPTSEHYTVYQYQLRNHRITISILYTLVYARVKKSLPLHKKRPRWSWNLNAVIPNQQ